MNNAVLTKIASTGISFIVTFFVGIIVPRVVGPEAYGDYSYLVATYLFLFQLFLFGLNTAYVYFLSGHRYSISSVNGVFFVLYICVVLLVGLVGLGDRLLGRFLWVDSFSLNFLLLGFCFCLLTNMQLRLIEFGDSTGNTVGFEMIRLAGKSLLLVLLLSLVLFDYLSINVFLWAQILVLICFLLGVYIFYRKDIVVEWPNCFSSLSVEIWAYIKPMVAFTLVAAFYSYMGKYLLQQYGGSEQQGIYQACMQLVLIPVAFLTSLTNIFLSRMVKLLKDEGRRSVSRYFSTWLIRLYIVHALFSSIMVFFPKEVVALVFGGAYVAGSEVVRYLAVFSLLHVFGLLSANLFYCSARNRLYSIINGLVMCFGVLVIITFATYYGLSAEWLAKLMCLFYSIRVLLQMIANGVYFSIDFRVLVARIVMVSACYVLFFLFWRQYMGGFFISIILSPLLLLGVNFWLEDVLRVRHVLSLVYRRVCR